MQPLEEQEDPTFASVAEPAPLQRPHCDQCLVAIADYECERCDQRFCRQCELTIHHRLEDLALKREESKSDGRPHQEFLNMYQCENCCASKHRQLGPHFFFCVEVLTDAFSEWIEGSSPKMFPFASWNLMFAETVKMSKGDLQDRAAATEAAVAVAQQPVKDLTSTKPSDLASAYLKTEQAVAASATGDTTMALENLVIDGSADPKDAPQPAVEQVKSKANQSISAFTSSIVDLTLDDRGEASPTSASSREPTQPQIKEETRIKAENAWLNSATAVHDNLAFNVDELMEKTMGEDEDPILRSMISEYNQLSAKIFDIDQEADSVRKKTKELSSTQPFDMQEVTKARVLANKLRKDKAESEKARDGVVANVVYYLKSDPDDLKQFLATCTAEVSYAQTACHRKCATLEATIRQNLENIRRIQRDMEELINMKKDAFAEVTRLGADIAQGEEDVRKLDRQRQDEFLRLCQFSKSIQTAVQEMAACAQ
uniref:B box-type domain-containing protein n=1 Tax=Hyaloperonospora arabidopsidis (strain Emoy2) TaxID=559515 RepID=M4C414_HYAAE